MAKKCPQCGMELNFPEEVLAKLQQCPFCTAPLSAKPVVGEPVDLGLSVRWADHNVGATNSEDYGDYFAWGEIEPKAEYTDENSLTYQKDDFNFDIAGSPKYDAATANWGGKWRMPTEEEYRELVEKCEWKWTSKNHRNGCKVTGPNGNSIFLPAAGLLPDSGLDDAGSIGRCWSSTPTERGSESAYNLGFGSGGQIVDDYACRDYGLSVRPVLAEKNEENESSQNTEFQQTSREAVDLGLPSGTKWANMNVGAQKPADYGDYFAWGEVKTKAEYTKENCQICGNSELGDIAGNANYDAATANWGVKWKMPTYEQMDELGSQCEWTWTNKNGVDGYKVTGPNGNSIFLPAAGLRLGSGLKDAGSDGRYWSSTPNEYSSEGAYYLYFYSHRQDVSINGRFLGQSVRPVLE